MKHRVKMICGIVLVFAAVWIVAVMVLPAFAGVGGATMQPSSVFVFAGSYSNAYVVMVDVDPGSSTAGMVFDKTTGIAADGETWEANYIAATQDDDSDFWKVTLPTLPDNTRIVLCIGDAASPTETDTTEKYYYDPVAKIAYSDEFPSRQGRLMVDAKP